MPEGYANATLTVPAAVNLDYRADELREASSLRFLAIRVLKDSGRSSRRQSPRVVPQRMENPDGRVGVIRRIEQLALG